MMTAVKQCRWLVVNCLQLRQAFVNQRNEITSLRDQLTLKDRRIHQLEEEVRALQATSTGHGVSSRA